MTQHSQIGRRIIGRRIIGRRTLLLGTTAAVLSGVASSCRPTAADAALKISLLEGSVPAEVLKKFRQQVGDAVQFQTANQLSDLFRQLQRWQSKQAPDFSLRQLLPWVQEPVRVQPDNLVSLGDYWLTSAIAQNLIDPIQLSSETLEKLPVAWQQFVSRGPKGQPSTGTDTPSGEPANILWAAPYKVQFLVVVYRQKKVSAASGTQPFSSWRDLLDPEFKNRIALPDHPRIVLGLLTKIQSDSFNLGIEGTADKPPTAKEIENQLARQVSEVFPQLDKQVKTYDADNSLKALINEDVDVAVSWSSEVVAAQRRYRELKMTIPAEGSLLSADLWVRPKGAEMSDRAKTWIDYCWEPGPATQISLSRKGLSPVFLGAEATLPAVLAERELSFEAIRNSEPLLPLSPDAQTAYFKFWQRMRGEEL